MKKIEDGKYRRFITMLKHLSINVPLVEALEKMPGYAKFMKDLVTKKRSVTFEDDDRMQHCRSIPTRSLVKKKEDTSVVIIPCIVSYYILQKHYVILGERINLMPSRYTRSWVWVMQSTLRCGY